MKADERYRGPWPSLEPLILEELDAYLSDAERPDLRTVPTRCTPWSGDQLTAHLAATFERFTAMLEQSRTGDLTAPFTSDGLAAENARAVTVFAGDPPAKLQTNATEFCRLAGDPSELMAHQLGPIPVGLQAAFGLSELALHHDDLLAEVGGEYRPAPAVVDALVPAWTAALGASGLAEAPDRWSALLRASGR